MEAVERYGALRGGLMAVGRVLRCHPLARGGHDPVVGRELGRESAGPVGGNSFTEPVVAPELQGSFDYA
jgi:hypothetical protein